MTTTRPRWARLAADAVVVMSILSVGLSVVLAQLAPRAPSELHLPRTLVFAVGILAFGFPAALVIDRQPRNPVGWILAWVAFTSAIPDVAAGYAAFALYGPGLPGGGFAAWLFSWTYGWAIGPAATILFLFFPDGRLLSRSWRPVAWIAGFAAFGFGASYALLPAPIPIFEIAKPIAVSQGDAVLTIFSISTALLLFATIASAASLFSRARGATVAEQQQLKWLALSAIVVALSVIGVLTLGVSIVPGADIVTYALLTVPIAIAVAVLRYRLYDIDVVINRALVYGAVSASLAITYVATVVLLQAVLRPFTSGSELAVAGSTLVVVALFQPLRARTQAGVDRRFYRSRYDAARTLDAFTSRMRNEVDIESVRADLLVAVGDTIRPAHAGVWLRERAR